MSKTLLLLAALGVAVALNAAPPRESPVISVGAGGRLVYETDEHGNRVPDFSFCGCFGGARPIPDAPVRIVVSPSGKDGTARIQQAIDYVASLPVDSNGMRGAVLLLRGRHEVFGGLVINASGVVLRGQGMTETGTVLVATGLDRRTLIRIAGRNDRTTAGGKSWEIKDDYVPVGSMSFHVKDAAGLKTGDEVIITRPSTSEWITRLGMTQFGGGQGDWRLVWKPGSRDLVWDRVVTAVEGDLVTVDGPITTALETAFGGARVEAYAWPGRLSHVGVENLRLESTFDTSNPKDENHSWCAITMENTENAWVRRVTARHFAGSMVAIYESCKWVSVEDCLSLLPVSEDGGYRRHTFFTMGQMTLFLRCFAERGRHDFSVGHCAAGPNAFVQCESAMALGDSGPIESWASGVLYDDVRIDGNGLSLANRGPSPHGAGWSAANSVLWNCSAAEIACEYPPTARNWAFGSWAEFRGDGVWRSSNDFVSPASLFVTQLRDRLGEEAAARINLMRRPVEGASNPSVEKAQELAAAARQPAPQLADFIVASAMSTPIPADPGSAKTAEELGDVKPKPTGRPKPVVLNNGWLTCDGRLLTGGTAGVDWWRGNVRPKEAESAGPGITRFVPGRTGRGFTDDLAELSDSMIANGQTALDHNYGLWHERRRDDHERVRRMNGDVWPPFYELPFARSGRGTAWDGLSRYDLTKFNPWYWRRLKDFADQCDAHGLVLFHENYFQHNILEAGAHWVDFPWRSVNNVNQTGFPEPPSYAGGKRIFMAEQFYDVTNPVRRPLHRAYIRQCLENFAGNSNVIQFTSAEYTGPLSFMEFWLDTVAEWEHETGHHPLVALSCTKDVQDAILADPKRSALVDVVDFRYWWRTRRGLFAPPGGKNLAPRQFERQWRGGRPLDTDLAQMAAEYRQAHPAKAVICNFDEADWAFVCAGGSQPRLPITTDTRLLAAIPRMQPWKADSRKESWTLSEPGKAYLVYSGTGSEETIDLSHEQGRFGVRIVSDNGKVAATAQVVEAGRIATIRKPRPAPTVLWLTRD